MRTLHAGSSEQPVLVSGIPLTSASTPGSDQHVASMPGFPASTYTKVLLLGAIAAASAFVVTILTVLLCIGCHRKGRRRNLQARGEHYGHVDTGALRQSKLRSFSKSDTRLHEMSRLTCNGGGTTKHRPASMDLLYVSSRRSNTDLRSASPRQLLKVPFDSGVDQEHTYSEVGQRVFPSRGVDDSLYESVGDEADKPQERGPSPGIRGDGSVPVTAISEVPQEPVTDEYACIRKVRKLDRSPRREARRQHDTHTDPQHASPHPPSREMPRRNAEPFHIHSFPKEVVFMGNGEQYIWKPPEEDDVLQHHLPASSLALPHSEGGQDRCLEISEMYSKVCKPNKKKWPDVAAPELQEGSRQRDQRWSSGADESKLGCSLPNGQEWLGEAQEKADAEEYNTADSCYESISEKAWSQGLEETEPAYETIDSNWKGGQPHSGLGKAKKRHQASRAPPGEHLYESISDVKQNLPSSSTTTVLTFKDGMEMYVTGL